MITREDLQEAIAECQGVRNPTANTCIKLAAYLTIREHLFGEKPDAPAGYSGTPKPSAVSAHADSEFYSAVEGKPESDVMAVFDDLMTALSVISPKLYAATLRKLSEI